MWVGGCCTQLFVACASLAVDAEYCACRSTTTTPYLSIAPLCSHLQFTQRSTLGDSSRRRRVGRIKIMVHPRNRLVDAADGLYASPNATAKAWRKVRTGISSTSPRTPPGTEFAGPVLALSLAASALAPSARPRGFLLVPVRVDAAGTTQRLKPSCAAAAMRWAVCGTARSSPPSPTSPMKARSRGTGTSFMLLAMATASGRSTAHTMPQVSGWCRLVKHMGTHNPPAGSVSRKPPTTLTNRSLPRGFSLACL